MKTHKILGALCSIFACIIVGGIFGSPMFTAILIGGNILVGASYASGYLFNLLGAPITFNGEEAREGILNIAYTRPDLNAFVTVVQNIVAKKQIAFLARTNKVTRKDTGCGQGVLSKTLTPTEKFWNPYLAKIWVQQCADDLEGTFFVWGLKKGIARKDLTSTDFEAYIMEVMSDAVADDVQRIGWFGDTAADTVANGGTIVNTSDPLDYNMVDGLWKQIFAEVVAGNTYTIAANAQATFALQDSTLAADEALKVFRALLAAKADSRLKTQAGKMIICTTSLFENWLTYKESQNFDRSFERQAMGFSSDVFRGVPIFAYDLWDRWIRADFQDGTAYYLPHRAICTIQQNLQFGFDASSELNTWKAFFDETTELNNLKGGYKFDTKLIFPYMISAAY